jgi:hypothetical protein
VLPSSLPLALFAVPDLGEDEDSAGGAAGKAGWWLLLALGKSARTGGATAKHRSVWEMTRKTTVSEASANPNSTRRARTCHRHNRQNKRQSPTGSSHHSSGSSREKKKKKKKRVGLKKKNVEKEKNEVK